MSKRIIKEIKKFEIVPNVADFLPRKVFLVENPFGCLPKRQKEIYYIQKSGASNSVCHVVACPA